MTTPRLHHVPFSRSFRILWLLEELGIPSDIVPYDIRSGNLRAGGFPALSPAARVPALEIDGIALAESGAIVEYLCETRAEAGFGRQPGDAERPAYLQWIHYAETMAALVEQLNLNHVFLRDPAEASPVVIKLNTARLRATLAGMEARMGDREYLLQGGFSGADVMMGFNLFAVPFFVRLDPFPRISAYRDRIAARPAYRRAEARDGPQTFYAQDFYAVPEPAP